MKGQTLNSIAIFFLALSVFSAVLVRKNMQESIEHLVQQQTQASISLQDLWGDYTITKSRVQTIDETLGILQSKYEK